MRVIITGASGFLGGVIIRQLAEAGHECIGVSRRKISGFLHVSKYSDAPEGDLLIHLAETSDRAVANAHAATLEADARQTLDALLIKGYRKIIYASSAALYGDRWVTPRNVLDPVEVVDTYTKIKFTSERAVLAQGGTVVRLGNIYGRGMGSSNVLSHILCQLGGNATITMNALEPIRDFLWVEDAARAIVKLATCDIGGLFNVGSGIGTSIRELVDLAQKGAASCQNVVALHMLDRLSHIVLDITGTTQALDWKPQTRLEAGVQELVNMKMNLEIQ